MFFRPRRRGKYLLRKRCVLRSSRRHRRHGVLLGALVLLVAGGSSSVGYQDLAGLLAHGPGVTERARAFVIAPSTGSLRMATFAWPSPTQAPLGASIPEPPRIPLAVEVNRTAKGDRLPLVEAVPLAPVASIGTHVTGAAIAAGTGTGGVSSGLGTDPAEAADAPAEMAAVDAGDPTGDPSEYDDAGEDEAVARLDGMIPDGPMPGDVVDIGGGVGESEDEALASAAGPDPKAGAPAAPPPAAQTASLPRPIYHEPAFIFGTDLAALPPQPFHYLQEDGTAGGSSVAAKGEVTGDDATPLSPAQRLGLDGKRRARAEKCLAEAVYFESRGEPERGQVAVAQVVMNRVFSGYYPSDVCRAVYQNANRKLACQFTFACDNVRDVVTEPELWKQASRIASDMLDGRVWDEKVGKATHYHASYVRPRWVREMRKLDRIGEHTFYRPRRWDS